MHTSSTRATRGRVASHLLLSALALALAACGGGGGSGADPAAATTGSTMSSSTSSAGAGSTATGSTVSAQAALQPAVVRVNAETAGQQTLADIATLQGGGYAIAYVSRPDSGTASVHVQRFGDDGQRGGAEAVIALAGGETDPTVAVLPDGGVALATLQTGAAAADTPWITRTSVLLRRHDASGALIGAPLQVATIDQDRTAAGAMHYIAAPKLVHWEDGSFLLAWSQVTDDASGKVPQFWARRFDATGQPIGANLPIGNGTAGSSLQLVAAPGGGFVIATTVNVSGGNWLLYRGFDGSKSPVLPPDALGAAEGSVLLPLYGGSQVLLSPVKNVVAVQRYDAQGQPQGAGLGLPAMPVGMAALRDGTFVLVVADGTGTLRAQHYDAQVQPIGAAQSIAGTATAVQGQALAGGGLALAWTASSAGDQDVMATRIAP